MCILVILLVFYINYPPEEIVRRREIKAESENKREKRGRVTKREGERKR